MNKCLHQCFNKIRVNNLEINKLFDKRRTLSTKSDNKGKKELCKLEEKLAELCAEENFKKSKDEVRGLKRKKGGGAQCRQIMETKKETEPKMSRATNSNDG